MSGNREDLISIIVPVYNIVPYIKECLESIQNQTYSNIEILVVDDGSEDGSGELCEEIAAQDDRIKVIRQKNAGVVAARGRGIKAALGTYMMFVDGDDWIEPDMAGKLVSQIVNTDLVTSGVFYQISSDKNVERYDEYPEGIYTGKVQMSEILESMIYDFSMEFMQRFTPWIYNKLYRSNLVKAVYAEVDQKITFAEDSVFLYKYLLKCQSAVVIHECYYHYRYRKGSAMHALNKHMLMDINRVYLALEPDFRKHELSGKLLFQLQKWVAILSCRAINDHMGFPEQIHIPEFIADLSTLEDKKIVLYGAGAAGKSTYVQIKRFGYQVVLWADKNYKFYQSIGMPVVSPDQIFHIEYDVIFLAVGEESLAEKIKIELLDKKFPAGKLMWKKPIRIF